MVQWVRLLASTAEGMGSTPGGGTKILHAVQHGQKQTNKQTKKWSIHTVEYYSALKEEEIMTQSTTWVNLEDITLREISPSQKDSAYVRYLEQ